VRALVHRHLPAEYREKQTWQRVASITTAAARGQLPVALPDTWSDGQ
jgi:hypothetical protein